MNSDFVMFSLLAIGSTTTAVLVITRRNPVMSLLYLIANFFFLAILYLSLHAQFIAVIQILVYAGAIMVLFLFVIMLLNLGNEHQFAETMSRKKYVALGLCFAMLAQLVLPFVTEGVRNGGSPSPLAGNLGRVEEIGKALFTRYVFPFEIVSILLLAAIVGAVVLAKKRFH